MIPETHYARASDGTYLAYQVVGDGPVDLVWQFDWFGDVDLVWELAFYRSLFTELAGFSRLILHDRRGTGLSSRNVPVANLETRGSDTLTVMDTVGSDRAVLTGVFEGGSPNVLLAATRPDRVRSVVWLEPKARSVPAHDYPWGQTPDETEAERRALVQWGTAEYGRVFVELENAHENEQMPRQADVFARLSRHWCTPDVALELFEAWYETDVRGVLPSVQVPALLLVHEDRPGRRAEAAAVASLMPAADLRTLSAPWDEAGLPAWADEIRRFVGVDRPPTDLDTTLATVLFTDIVGATERQAALGNREWKVLVERHHAAVRQSLARWHGVERDTAGDGFFATFDGPARAIRCGLEAVARVSDLGLEVRVGLHTGECEIIDGKVGGLAVSIGARVAALAAPSEVLVSQTVKDLVAGSGLGFADAGEHELKGVPDRWRLHRVTG